MPLPCSELFLAILWGCHYYNVEDYLKMGCLDIYIIVPSSRAHRLAWLSSSTYPRGHNGENLLLLFRVIPNCCYCCTDLIDNYNNMKLHFWYFPGYNMESDSHLLLVHHVPWLTLCPHWAHHLTLNNQWKISNKTHWPVVWNDFYMCPGTPTWNYDSHQMALLTGHEQSSHTVW